MAFLDVVGTFIESNTTGFQVHMSGLPSDSTGTPVFKHSWPSTPDTLIGLYEQPSRAPEWSMGSTEPTIEHVRLQVLSRSTSYQTARNNAQTIYEALDHKIVNTTPNSTGDPLYLQVAAAHAPADAGRDQNQRHLVSINFDTQKERG